MQNVHKAETPPRYPLDMQVLSDELEVRQIPHHFHNCGGASALESVRFFRRGEKLRRDFVYLLPASDCGPDLRAWEGVHFISIGEALPDNFSLTSSVLSLPAGSDPRAVYNAVQQIFEKYTAWDAALGWALGAEKPLERMLAASQEIFENPLFIHDADFHILACPRRVEGMLRWEREARTGREMVPAELAAALMADPEYLASLDVRQAAMSSSARGSRVLFSNLWSRGRYSGRICVDELERPIRRSDYLHLAHLAEMVALCLERQGLPWLSLGGDMDRFFTGVLEGKPVSSPAPRDYLRALGWKQEDKYLVLKIAPAQEGRQDAPSAAAFVSIVSRAAAGRAFLYRRDIAVIVDLTASHLAAAEVLSALAPILRAGLFKAGASTELEGLCDIRAGYIQASAALEYGESGGSSPCLFRFDDHALRFLLDCGRRQIRPALLISEKLRKLKAYDAENHTELFHTLEVYLKLERNVVQTAKALFIHRSTLFYRLDRIRKIAGINDDDAQERLYLLLSYRLESMDE